MATPRAVRDNCVARRVNAPSCSRHVIGVWNRSLHVVRCRSRKVDRRSRWVFAWFLLIPSEHCARINVGSAETSDGRSMYILIAWLTRISISIINAFVASRSVFRGAVFRSTSEGRGEGPRVHLISEASRDIVTGWTARDSHDELAETGDTHAYYIYVIPVCHGRLRVPFHVDQNGAKLREPSDVIPRFSMLAWPSIGLSAVEGLCLRIYVSREANTNATHRGITAIRD